MYIKINKDSVYIKIGKDSLANPNAEYDTSYYYEVYFQACENDTSNYLELCNLLGIFDICGRGDDPIDAIERLNNTVKFHIHSLGIDSTKLTDELDELCKAKILELNESQCLNLVIDKHQLGYLSSVNIELLSKFTFKRVFNEYEDTTVAPTIPIKYEDTTVVPTIPIKHLRGRGVSKKESMTDLLNACKKYEEIIHEYVFHLEKIVNEQNECE